MTIFRSKRNQFCLSDITCVLCMTKADKKVIIFSLTPVNVEF